MRKFTLQLFFIFFTAGNCLLASNANSYLCKIDVVYLNNGSIIKGELIELKVRESVTIETIGGSIFVFSMDEVERITREDCENNQGRGVNRNTLSPQNFPDNSTSRSLNYVNPGTSQILGILIAGGGHIYSGETFTGLALLGISVGAPIAGWTLSEWDNMTPYYIGLGVTGVTWLYSIVDSSKAARRANTRQGITFNDNFYLTPNVLATKHNKFGYGLSLSANF